MAPKKSASKGKGSDAASGEAEIQGWKSSKCTDSHLLNLVESHLLQPRNVIHCRRSDGESFSHEEGNESVVFLPHVLRGPNFQFLISSEVSFTIGDSSVSLDP